MLPDLSKLLPEQRTQLALKIQGLSDFTLPELKYWNYSPCSRHTDQGTVSWCRDCGLIPRAHQRTGSAWLLTKKKALLADETGLGKTATLGLLIAMLKELGELENGRILVTCRAAAVRQWERELNRMLVGIRVVTALGSAKKRFETLSSDWDVIISGKEIFVRDWEAYNQVDLMAMFVDDCDELRHRKTRFAHAAKKIAAHTRWTVVANATPLAKDLRDLHSTSEMVGGRELFGSENRFMQTYTTQQKIQLPVRGGRMMTTKKVTGYINLNDFKAKLEPIALRRTASMLDDVDMPLVVPQTVFIELHPAQRQKYRELQEGVLKIIKSGRVSEVKMIEALQIWAKGMACCAGLPALGEDDGPQASAKMDWVMSKLNGDLEREKVLIFIHNIAMIKAAQVRLEAADIGYTTISGLDSSADRRNEAVQKFWDDDSCRVLLMTKAGTSSLNLQTARHLIYLDSIANPASMLQLLGRLKRQGSRFPTVYTHTLIASDTADEALLSKLELEAALMDTVWSDSNDLFQALDPETLLRMIAG